MGGELDTERLKAHVATYVNNLQSNEYFAKDDVSERQARIEYYQSWTEERLLNITEDELFVYLSKLWAMRTWGNKKYYIDKVINDNGIKKLGRQLALLVWGDQDISNKWDDFISKNIKGIGIAMMSEILCHVHPADCFLWNRRTRVGLNHLGVQSLPRYNYQMNGNRYKELSSTVKQIQQELEQQSGQTKTLLDVDYFIWRELQVVENLSRLSSTKDNRNEVVDIESKDASKFIHDEIRDKISDIGNWLGFDSKTEKIVADGSRVDVVWEAGIGNMGLVIFVFEVQTKGSMDSLLINLLKSLKNPAVQGVVAVSDSKQLEILRRHAADVDGLHVKLKYWDYEEVLAVHDSFEVGYDSINKLGLVPQGF